MVADEGTFEEWDQGLATRNPLDYKGYEEKLEVLKEKTGLDEAVITGKAWIHGQEVALGVCDGRFSHGQHGRSGGREDRPGGRKSHRRKTSDDHLRMLRGCQDAGGNHVPDADGQDFRCP